MGGCGGMCWLKTMSHDSIFQAHEQFIMQNKGRFSTLRRLRYAEQKQAVGKMLKCSIGRFAVWPLFYVGVLLPIFGTS